MNFQRLRVFLPWIYLVAGVAFILIWFFQKNVPTMYLLAAVMIAIIGATRVGMQFVKKPEPEKISITEDK
ncbi:MAG: hypothetical protein K1Y36_23565 [Blastocatellia bacterium]|nr:hypothetical protein [Blastocatellia bacterium]